MDSQDGYIHIKTIEARRPLAPRLRDAYVPLRAELSGSAFLGVYNHLDYPM
jgi:hypothetical protein